LLRKPRVKTEVYNDLNEDLHNLFRILQDASAAVELCRLCELTPFSRREFDSSYGPTDDRVEQARRFIIRSFFGFGSKACITDKQNGFRNFRYTDNSPAVDWARYPVVLATVANRLRGVVIESRPALDVIRRFDRTKTLFYLDPPYVHSTRNIKSGSYRYEMTNEDHAELADALHQIKGMAIISGYDCDLYRNLYAGWTRKAIGHRADMGAARVECIWISPAAMRNAQYQLPGVA
jgi:DNA adenine methylase